MANKVIPTPYFESKFKRLAKKSRSLANDLLALEDILVAEPTLGEPLGTGIYKIRLANKDKGKRKSDGFRIITYLIREKEEENEIFLITISIYDKSEEKNIIKADLIKLINDILD